MRRVLPLLALALLFAPAAQAGPTVRATAPGEPVAPDAPVPVVLEVGIDCVTLWSREVVTVALGAVVPENVTIAGPTEADYHKTDCPVPRGEAVKRHAFEATVAHGARAGTSLTLYLEATVPGDATTSEAFGVAQVDLVPAHVPRLQVHVAQQIKEASSGVAPFQVRVDNLGNDDVDVTFRVVEGPGRGGGVDLPDPVHVLRGDGVEATFTVRLGDDADQATVRIAVNATRTGTGGGAEELYSNVLVRRGGFLTDVREAPAVPPLPLLLLGLAVAARARRR